VEINCKEKRNIFQINKIKNFHIQNKSLSYQCVIKIFSELECFKNLGGATFLFSHIVRITGGRNGFSFKGETIMHASNRLKIGLNGAVVGAVATMIVGFSLGGWVTGGTAEEMARLEAQREVVAALVPICIAQSRQDPKAGAQLALMKDASKYKRSGLLMKAGWATMPGSSDPDSTVAGACMEQLAAKF
jgi:hypothetical protein